MTTNKRLAYLSGESCACFILCLCPCRKRLSIYEYQSILEYLIAHALEHEAPVDRTSLDVIRLPQPDTARAAIACGLNGSNPAHETVFNNRPKGGIFCFGRDDFDPTRLPERRRLLFTEKPMMMPGEAVYPGFCRNMSSISVRAGIDGAVPGRVTEMDAVAVANRIASPGDMP